LDLQLPIDEFYLVDIFNSKTNRKSKIVNQFALGIEAISFLKKRYSEKPDPQGNALQKGGQAQ
jgi:hypothetical protein